MYDELVKRLRYCSGEHSGCGTCELSDNCVLRAGLLLQAADAIEKLSKPRWISVEERLPDQNSGNLYICLIVGGEWDQLSWYELCDFAEGQFWIQDQLYKGHVTHWMPLPEPPKEEET